LLPPHFSHLLSFDQTALTDQMTAYLSTFTGVGFVYAGDFVEDLERANDVGLVFLNAPYQGDKRPSEIIRVGVETGHIAWPTDQRQKQ
jgi:hypothetical protein